MAVPPESDGGAMVCTDRTAFALSHPRILASLTHSIPVPDEQRRQAAAVRHPAGGMPTEASGIATLYMATKLFPEFPLSTRLCNHSTC